MSDSTALTTTSQQQGQPGALAFLHNGAAFEHLWRVAKAFSMSGMVPPHFQGKPESCMVALMYAEQLGEHPMVMFQETGVINGRPSTSARFAIARANKSGLLQGVITWTEKGQGDALEVTASATLRETGEVIQATVTMREAIADQWTRNNKYKSIPGQMLRWRAATRLINLYMPEVLFGLGVKEEIEQVTVREAPAQASGSVVTDLNRQIAASVVSPASDSGENPTIEKATPNNESKTPEVIDVDDPF
jgi:hypothetical protein